MVRLNRAVTVAEAEGPAAALAIVDQLGTVNLPDNVAFGADRE